VGRGLVADYPTTIQKTRRSLVSERLRAADELERLNDNYAREAAEVRGVEGEEMRDTVRHHHCHKPRVVNLSPAHVVALHKGAPVSVDGGGFFKEREYRLDVPGLLVSFGRRSPEPVGRERSSGEGLELDQVLCGDKDRLAPEQEHIHSTLDQAVERVGRQHTASSDVRIGQVIHRT